MGDLIAYVLAYLRTTSQVAARDIRQSVYSPFRAFTQSTDLIPTLARMRNAKPNYTVKIRIFRSDRTIGVTHDALPQEFDAVQDMMECDSLFSIGRLISVEYGLSGVVNFIETFFEGCPTASYKFASSMR